MEAHQGHCDRHCKIHQSDLTKSPQKAMDGKWQLSPSSQRFREIAVTALISLSQRYPNVHFCFVEEEFWLFFFDIIQHHDLPLNCLPLSKDMPPLTTRRPGQSPRDFLQQGDVVAVIGRPYGILQGVDFISDNLRVLCVPIPVVSYTLQTSLWKHNCDVVGFAAMCCPFIPCREYVRVPIGTFRALFLGEPVYERKAMRAMLAALQFVFGKFERVYGIGEFSKSVTEGFMDATRDAGAVPDGRNIMIMVDRTVDLQSMVFVHGSYQGYLEELGIWKDRDSAAVPERLAPMLGMKHASDVESLPLFGERDDIFEVAALLSLTEAQKRISVSGIRTGIREQLQDLHQRILQSIQNTLRSEYMLDLLTQVQIGAVDAEKDARILVYSAYGHAVAYRMLSILKLQGKIDKAKGIAPLIATVTGLPAFAKWSALEPLLEQRYSVEPPRQIRSVGRIIPTMVSVVSSLVADEWKRPNFPVETNYMSTKSPVAPDKHRWLIFVAGGMTATELRVLRMAVKNCRPDDEFVFMTTEIVSPNHFMTNLIR